jgi:MFS family permease
MGLRLPPALRHRRFTLLWAGLIISLAGSQMQLWALFWHIRTLSPNPIAVSGIGLARMLPVVIFSLFGGLVADSLNRRNILFITQITMTLVAVALGWLTWQGHINLWEIYGLTAIQAVAQAYDGPARQAMVPNLVPVEDLPSAFSVQSIASNVGAIIGPALSGLVIAYLGQQYAYWINAISFLAVLIALLLMGPVAQQTRVRSQSVRLGIDFKAIEEGIRFILNQPIILSSMILDFFATFWSSANTLLPYVARDVLHVGAVAYGWLSAGQSIGSISAALVISQRDRIHRQGTVLLVAVTVFGFATIWFGVARSLVMTMLALIVIGAGDAVSTIIRNTIRQLQTPDFIRGRMTSVNQIFFMGGPQLGEVESGLVAEALGTPMAIVIGGVGCLLAIGWIAWRWPQLRRYNGDEPILAGATAS